MAAEERKGDKAETGEASMTVWAPARPRGTGLTSPDVVAVREAFRAAVERGGIVRVVGFEPDRHGFVVDLRITVHSIGEAFETAMRCTQDGLDAADHVINLFGFRYRLNDLRRESQPW